MTEAEETLRRNFDNALEVLARKFKIDDLGRFPRPEFLVCQEGTGYEFEKNRIQFNENQVSSSIAIGEEASHYIHLQLNPLHKTRVVTNFDVIAVITLIEVIGRYGALAYLKEKGEDIEPFKKRKGAFATDSTQEFVEQMSHHFGYESAYKLMELHGDAMLPALSRMGLDEGLKAVSRLAPITFYERKIMPLVDRITGYKPNLNGSSNYPSI